RKFYGYPGEPAEHSEGTAIGICIRRNQVLGPASPGDKYCSGRTGREYLPVEWRRSDQQGDFRSECGKYRRITTNTEQPDYAVQWCVTTKCRLVTVNLKR